MSTLSLSFTLLLLLPLSGFASFVLQIPVEGEHCFVLRAPPNSLLSGNWDSLEDHLSPNPIRFKILKGDNMKNLYETDHGKSEDTFRVSLKNGGRLYACIQNGIDVESEDELDRTVGLDLRITQLPLDDAPSQQLLNQAESIQRGDIYTCRTMEYIGIYSLVGNCYCASSGIETLF
jgi:hypothetical protein